MWAHCHLNLKFPTKKCKRLTMLYIVYTCHTRLYSTIFYLNAHDLAHFSRINDPYTRLNQMSKRHNLSHRAYSESYSLSVGGDHWLGELSMRGIREFVYGRSLK